MTRTRISICLLSGLLLYLKLQGNNAGVPLQNWWQGIANRLSL